MNANFEISKPGSAAPEHLSVMWAHYFSLLPTKIIGYIQIVTGC